MMQGRTESKGTDVSKVLIPKPLASVVLRTASAAGTHGKHGTRRNRNDRRTTRQALRKGEWA